MYTFAREITKQLLNTCLVLQYFTENYDNVKIHIYFKNDVSVGSSEKTVFGLFV